MKKRESKEKLACELFGVSESGFYDWLDRPPCARKRKDMELKVKIVKIYESSKKSYGSPRIFHTLKNEGLAIGRNRVVRLMRQENIRAKKKKSFVPKTTINNPSEMKFPRIFIAGKTKVTAPNRIWNSDITYIPTKEGFLYFSGIKDLFHKSIVGWDLSERLTADGLLRALNMALKKVPGNVSGLIFHSDQGSQYCSEEVKSRLKALGVLQSMSRKGNCYDNSDMETFFASMKGELGTTIFQTKEEARKAIFEYVESWYNTKRLHSALGYMSPKEFEIKNWIAA